MGDTARSIAAGDLAARVDLGRHPDDELADLARTLNAMAAQLEHAQGMERAFVLSVSHDLRTPLTSIRGYAEAMIDGTVEHRRRAGPRRARDRRRGPSARAARRRPPRPGPARRAAVLARAAPDRRGRHRPHRGRRVPSRRPRTSASRSGVDGPDALRADADPDRLAQIVANLVENALKYAAASIVVELAAYGTGDLDLRVRDDGPGIDPADLPAGVRPALRVAHRPGPQRRHRHRARDRARAGRRDGRPGLGRPRADGTGATFVVRLPILRADPRPRPRPRPPDFGVTAPMRRS